MPRRSSFVSLLNAIAREQARAQRRAEAERRRQERERLQAIRAAERATALATAEARQQYLARRAQEAEEMNLQLSERLAELQSILEHTLRIDDAIAFDSLRIHDPFPLFFPPSQLASATPPPDRETFLGKVKPPSFLMRLIPGAAGRHRSALQHAEQEYQHASEAHTKSEAERMLKLNELKSKYDAELQVFNQKVHDRNSEVDALAAAYFAKDPNAVVTYNSVVLERSAYPEGFPQEFRLAYIPESNELVAEYELPIPDVVPAVEEYRYIKSKDQIGEKARKPADKRALYQDIVASIALRTIHEVFEADQGNTVAVFVFNGFVQSVDPATGKDIRPHLISVRVTKDRFKEINLSKIDKQVCLRNLGAQVSPRPYEVQPVKPIIEFDMVDKRFVDQSDILADLESRPNLMDLNPFEFENLIANLFDQMGLETKLTRSHRDGGVDVVAFDTRPVLGGKVVIQAKRYRYAVGVSAVRDLYGTMINEGANKGLLVTTSGYGPDAFEFAKDKPIELMDGGQLLYLLEQVGVKARIIFPEEGA
jgi:restriction system protein